VEVWQRDEVVTADLLKCRENALPRTAINLISPLLTVPKDSKVQRRAIFGKHAPAFIATTNLIAQALARAAVIASFEFSFFNDSHSIST
jgi:hypothetical protein